MGDGRVIDDPHYTTPLYRKAEAAHIIAVPGQTFRNWAVGYVRKRLDGSQVVSAPIVTTLEPARPRGASVPFVGLAEAYIVAAFTKAGLPMQRIRPAVLWLQDHIGLPQALASQRLQTDGAEGCGTLADSQETRRTWTWLRVWSWSAAASRSSGQWSVTI